MDAPSEMISDAPWSELTLGKVHQLPEGLEAVLGQQTALTAPLLRPDLVVPLLEALGALHRVGEQVSTLGSGTGFALRQELPQQRGWADQGGPGRARGALCVTMMFLGCAVSSQGRELCLTAGKR